MNLVYRAILLTFFENDFESIPDYVHELKNRYIESIEDYL